MFHQQIQEWKGTSFPLSQPFTTGIAVKRGLQCSWEVRKSAEVTSEADERDVKLINDFHFLGL